MIFCSDDDDETGLEFMQLREKNVAERVSQLDEAVMDLHHQLDEIRQEMQGRKDNVSRMHFYWR